MIKNLDMKLFLMALTFFFGGCEDKGTGWTPDIIPDDPEITPGDDADTEGIHTYNAPLYWSVYEYCWKLERRNEELVNAGGQGQAIDMSESSWQYIIDYVAENLLPYGYNMICTDGFMAMDGTSEPDPTGYMTKYGSVKLKKLSEMCKAKGLKLGVYDNPLSIHGPEETIIEGTDNITFKDLRYKQGEDNVLYPDADDGFSWVVASHKGAEEYIDGFFKYYKNLGVDFIRMDFLCYYENGYDRGMNAIKGKGYGRENYKLALQYICKAAKKYGVFTSLVMPNMHEDAALEREYGNMARIVGDTWSGGWHHVSNSDRGKVFEDWPSCGNMFDGFTHWSKYSGRGKMIMDGDFIRLNTFGSDAEKESVISLQLMAGGPVAIADVPGDSFANSDLKFCQNEEMLALNKDGFVGKPLSDVLNSTDSQIWYGQMTNGDWVIGLFNREDSKQFRSVKFSDLGIEGKMKVRDLWKHADEGEADNLNVELEAHACKIVRLTKL